MQTNNNDYYLTHNDNKEHSKYGSIFIDYNSSIKDRNSNVIIYGHNRKDTQMFGSLMNYESKKFYDLHPTITIATDESISEYQIMYVFKSRVFYSNETNVFRYYQYHYFNDKIKYDEYLNHCKLMELYDTEIRAECREQIITLITCEYSQDNGRMVIVAKRINFFKNFV